MIRFYSIRYLAMSLSITSSSITPDFLKTLTYPRPDLNNCILRTPPPSSPPPPALSPRLPASLGALDTLPLELLHDIILSLPLSALSPLLATSSTTHSLLLSSPAYRNLTTHATHALRAYSATALGDSVTVSQLLAALCAESCAHCGDFGPFLWLLDCTRCCWACMTQHPDLLPLTPEEACETFGIPHLQIPVLRSVPGVYRTWKELCVEPESRRLVSKAAARRVAVKVHGGAEGLERFLSAAAVADTARVSKGALLDSKDADVRRHLGVIPLPTLDRKAGLVDHGVSCKGCTSTLPVVALRREGAPCMPVRIGSGLEGFDARKRELGRMFTTEGYLAHYEVCGRARELWEREFDDEVDDEDEEEWDMEEADRRSPFL